jgi:hypothetical protein
MTEHTLQLDLGIHWSAGAPTPTVLADETDVYLVFDLAETEGESSKSGLITWRHCVAMTFGFPNDEAQHGHRLWRGKDEQPPFYAAVEVADSAWIEELRNTERVHPRPSEAPFSEARHFVLFFHDSTFECIAHGYEVERRQESAEDVVAKLANDRVNRAGWIGPSRDMGAR